MSYVYLGYGTTNSEGVAHLDHDADGEPIYHSYTSVGAGEIDVLASLDNPIVEGSIVSETYNVLDCVVYDGGTLDNHNDSIWTTQNVTFQPRQAEYTDIVKGTGSSLLVSTDLPIGSVIEFEMRQIGGTTTNYIFGLRQGTSFLGNGTRLYDLGANVDEWVRIKIELKDDGYAIATNLDDTSKTDQVNSTAYTSDPKFAFWLSDNAITDLYFRNFKVYPI